MIEKEMSRRSLFKSSLVGATAVGAAGFGLASTAEAAPKKAKAETFDAIVLGAGPAGLITAITAHDAGAKVVVLEKCDRPTEVGCCRELLEGATRLNRASRIRPTPSTP